MTKIVYNACYGGFGLSEEAVLRYAELKGIRLYPEDRRGYVTWWKVPPEERTGILSDEEFRSAPLEARQASNARHAELTLDPDKIDRADPILAQVVEELGAAANGSFADLKVFEVPAGTRYRIDEYDGSESVETPDSYDWKVA